MLFLTFDMASPSPKVGLVDQGLERLEEIELPPLLPGDYFISQVVNFLKKEKRSSFKEIDFIVTTLGPGSFTGVRLGLAAAKGFRLSTKKPIFGFTSFLVLSRQGQKHLGKTEKTDFLFMAIEGKRKDLYGQIFDLKKGEFTSPPFSFLPEKLADLLGPLSSYSLIGDGISRLKPFLPLSVQEVFEEHVDLKMLATLGVEKFQKKKEEDEDDPFLLPYYVRPADTTLL